jgi:hypothetical protein
MTMLARDTHALYDPVRTPFELDERDFPASGTLEDQFRFLLRYAILAPSTYNTQPWRFAVSENGIEAYADYTRRMPFVDPGNRELLLSIGAAVATLRVAAAHFGFSCLVEYNHTGSSDRPLAIALLTPVAAHPIGDAARARLFPAVARRRTNRRAFLLSRIPRSALEAFGGLDAGRVSSLTVSPKRTHGSWPIRLTATTCPHGSMQTPRQLPMASLRWRPDPMASLLRSPPGRSVRWKAPVCALLRS